MKEDEFSALENSTTMKTTDIFNSYDRLPGIGSKPLAVWFSAGSWVYDGGDNKEIHKPDYQKPENCPMKCKMIKSTYQENILTITDGDELVEFTDKYKYDLNTEIIDWNKVANDGYWGIRITFRKLRHVGVDWKDAKWFTGWDVESLAVWGLEAFGKTLEIEDIVI